MPSTVGALTVFGAQEGGTTVHFILDVTGIWLARLGGLGWSWRPRSW